MSRSGLFNFENEPIWLIQDSNSLFFLNHFGRTVSVTRDTRFGVGRTVPATPDTRIRLVVLVYCQARATPNDRLRPTAATTVNYHVGLQTDVPILTKQCRWNMPVVYLRWWSLFCFPMLTMADVSVARQEGIMCLYRCKIQWMVSQVIVGLNKTRYFDFLFVWNAHSCVLCFNYIIPAHWCSCFDEAVPIECTPVYLRWWSLFCCPMLMMAVVSVSRQECMMCLGRCQIQRMGSQVIVGLTNTSWIDCLFVWNGRSCVLCLNDIIPAHCCSCLDKAVPLECTSEDLRWWSLFCCP
jgi:hypothetical protein